MQLRTVRWVGQMIQNLGRKKSEGKCLLEYLVVEGKFVLKE